MSRQQCCAIALTQLTLCPCLGQSRERGSRRPRPHAPMASAGWALPLQLSALCRIPEPSRNLRRNSHFGPRQGCFFHFVISAPLFPFSLRDPKPHGYYCVKREKHHVEFLGTLRREWRETRLRCLILNRGWLLT